MSNKQNFGKAISCLLSFVFALAICLAFPMVAFAADNVQLDAPTTVSDDITRLHVNKLDADTHEYLAGATMAIVNEKTGEVVDSWVTGKSTHENEKGLDVGVTYVLREIEAPEGYGKVEGIITDGDIRRAMERWQKEFFNRNVGDIMTRQPKTVSRQTKIADVQRLMNRHKIHSVLVADADHRLIGIVDRYACVL